MKHIHGHIAVWHLPW